MKKFFESLLDFIYRKKCYFCGKSKYSVKMCPDCYEELCFSEFRVNRVINGVDIYSCGVYEKNLQKLIRGIKFHKQKDLAYYLAKFMWEYFQNLSIDKQFMVVPVPLHSNRIKKRKYNQMELVAEEFCKLSGNIPCFELMKRVKDTKPQYKLTSKERKINLKNAFDIDKTKLESVKKYSILIMDDICSTGSTFEEMINVLKANGFEDIICLSASSP